MQLLKDECYNLIVLDILKSYIANVSTQLLCTP